MLASFSLAAGSTACREGKDSKGCYSPLLDSFTELLSAIALFSVLPTPILDNRFRLRAFDFRLFGCGRAVLVYKTLLNLVAFLGGLPVHHSLGGCSENVFTAGGTVDSEVLALVRLLTKSIHHIRLEIVEPIVSSIVSHQFGDERPRAVFGTSFLEDEYPICQRSVPDQLLLQE
jgi:hypothetical protein